MPKPVCSLGWASKSNNRHRRHPSKSTPTLLWTKAKSAAASDDVDIAEPSSPKVTCAGQIKVTQSTTTAWNSMMDARLRKRSKWAESVGFKREIMQFLTFIRTLRFDLRCFGSFPHEDITTVDDEEEEESYEENDVGLDETGDDATGALVSKWFMMLEENQNMLEENQNNVVDGEGNNDGSMAESAVPPPNALLLMRCRSAPAKSWLEENQKQVTNAKEKEGTKKTEDMVALRYECDFEKMSLDIAKESWIVGRLRDTLSKSRSWKT